MKKLFSFVAIALLVMAFAVPAFAAANTTAYAGGSGINTTKTVTTINTSATGTDETNISTTAYFIPSKCLLLGYEVQVLGASSDGTASIIDKASTTTGDADTKIVSESEATLAYPRVVMFPQGIRLSNGLTIKQNEATSVTVYYIQDRP